MCEPMIRVENLTKVFRSGDSDLVVLDGVDLEFSKGQSTALVGESGAGKTTLLHLLATVPTLERTLVMVQAEVGHRIAAPPGSKVYGSPSVKARWYGPWRVEGTISRQVFWPVPNVDSVLVGMTRTPPPGSEADRVRLGQIVDAAFGQRRKMLRQALAEHYGSSAAATVALQAAGLDPTARGEQLGFDDYLRLAQAPPS